MNGVVIERYSAPSALVFWVADDTTGVFAVNSRDEKGREETFSTSDGKLTGAFSSIFERLWLDNGDTLVQCPTVRHADLGPGPSSP